MLSLLECAVLQLITACSSDFAPAIPTKGRQADRQSKWFAGFKQYLSFSVASIDIDPEESQRILYSLQDVWTSTQGALLREYLSLLCDVL